MCSRNTESSLKDEKHAERMSPGEYSRNREQNLQGLGSELEGDPSHECG